MKLKFLTLLTSVVLLFCLSFLAFRLYDWWQSHRRQKALFVYFQRTSPLTRRIPADALLYINLYDLKRIHDELRKTRFNDVWTYWLDTGMSDGHKANPLRGGMLEKTILNVVGQEFAVSLLPSQQRPVDFLMIARIASGSEFVLKLALLSSKDAQKVDYHDGTIYVFETKHLLFPKIYVFLENDLAFAASSIQRLQESADSEGSGPAFLRNRNVQAIPEDTFLFAESRDPVTFMLGYGRGNRYHLRASSETYPSRLPKLKENNFTVLHFQTNITEILRQPSVSYLLSSRGGRPVSSALLGFQSSKDAKMFQQSQIGTLPDESSVPLQTKKMDCYQTDGKILCHHDANILLAEHRSELNQSAGAMNTVKERQLPLTFTVLFHRERILDYVDRAQKKDWSKFATAKQFYFLSCIRQMKNTGSELTIELD